MVQSISDNGGQEMNYDEFVVKLINGTKSNSINWQRCKSKRFPHYYPAYETQKGGNILVIQKIQYSTEDAYGDSYTTTSAEISICSTNYETLSEIYESDLQNESHLLRLYRIVERQTNDVDNILGNFVEGIDDITGLF